MFQHTLRKAVAFEGVSLHLGEDARVAISPADIGAGVVFRRRDLMNGDAERNRAAAIRAAPQNVVKANHGTTIANAAGATAATIEHLMAALALCRVDNAIIDLDGPEVPILDGSAAAFVDAIHGVGLREQAAPRQEIVLAEPIRVIDEDRFITIDPEGENVLSVTIDFGDCLIGRQSVAFSLDDPGFADRLAQSRTFCRIDEVEALSRAGLIRGGSLDNSIVVDGARVLNKGALRDQDEFVLHKALDLIGDLYLLGAPLRGAIRAHKPGHDLNTRAALAAARTLAKGVAEDVSPMAATA